MVQIKIPKISIGRVEETQQTKIPKVKNTFAEGTTFKEKVQFFGEGLKDTGESVARKVYALGQAIPKLKDQGEAFRQGTLEAASAVEQTGAKATEFLADVTKKAAPAVKIVNRITGRSPLTAPALEFSSKVYSSVSDRLSKLAQDDFELSRMGIKVEDPRKFSEAIEDPDFIAKGIARTAPNLIASLGIGTAATITTGPVGGGLAMFGTAAALEGGTAYNEAKEYGASEQKATNAMLITGTVNGLLETTPLMKFLQRTGIGRQVRRKVFQEVAKDIAAQTAEESATESMQEIVSNAVARTYNENQELFEGVPESAYFGAVLGGGLGVGGGVINSNPSAGLSIQDVSGEGDKKYNRTLNVNDKEDAEQIARVFNEEAVQRFQQGDFTYGTRDKARIEEILGANLVNETPQTTEQKLEGRVEQYDLPTRTIYHGTTAENTQTILDEGFKRGSELSEEAFRGGGYGATQDSISFSIDPSVAAAFTGSSQRGVVLKSQLKDDANVVTVEGIDHAEDLNDFVGALRAQGIDAVYLAGEQEVAVINPDAVTKPTEFEEFDVFGFNRKNDLGFAQQQSQESQTQEVPGTEVAQIVDEIGTDGDVSDFLLDQIRQNSYELQEKSIAEILESDQDARAYVEANELREFADDNSATPIVIDQKGEVLDGYNRLLQAVQNENTTISAYVAIKGKSSPSSNKVLGKTPAPFIKKRETTLLKERIRNVARGFREGRRFTKAEIQTVQNELIDVIESSELDLNDRAKFTRAVKNVQTPEQLAKALPQIQERIEGLETQSSRRKLIARIKKTLKKTAVKKQGGKPVGKYLPTVQNALDMLREASKLTQEQAGERIALNLEKYKDGVFPDDVALENIALGIFADTQNVSIEKLESLANAVDALIEEGRLVAELKRFNRAADVDQWTSTAVNVVTGGKGVPSSTRTTGVAEVSASTLSERVQKFMSKIGKSIVGWDDILDMISSKEKSSNPGESWLNRFGDVTEQENAEKKGRRIVHDKLHSMAMEAFGLENDRQLVRKFRDDAKEESLGTFKNGFGQEVEITFTKAEARKRWLEMQDESLQDTLTDGMGYTQEIRSAIEGFLTEQDKAFARAQLSFYQEYYSGVNEVYSDIYGVALPQNDTYSPIRREGIDRELSDGFGEFFQEIATRSTITSGSLKSRVKNIKPLAKRADVAVLEEHVAEMEHFKAWALKMRDLNAVFGDATFRTAVIREYGQEMLAMVDNFTKDFTRGGSELASRLGILDKLRGNYTRGVLAIKPSIGIKQLTSFIAYADAIPVKDFSVGVADFWTNPVKHTRILMQSEMLRNRGEHMERDVKTAVNSDAYASFRKSKSFLNTLMMNIQIGDQGAIITGGWSVYKYWLPKVGHEKALLKFEQVTSITQQSGDLSKQSYWQRGGSYAKLFTMFKSSPNQYFRKELGAIRGIVTGRGSKVQHAKTIVIFHFLLPMFFQWVSDWFQWDPEEQKRAAILGSFNGIFIFGDLLDSLIRTSLGLRVFDNEIAIYSIGDDISKAIKLIGDDDITTEDVFKAIRGMAGATGSITGVPLKQPVDATLGIGRILNGDYERGISTFLGWSPYTIEERTSNSGSPSVNIPKVNVPKVNIPKVRIPTISI